MKHYIKKDKENYLISYVAQSSDSLNLNGYEEISEELADEIKSKNGLLKIIGAEVEVIEEFENIDMEESTEKTINDVFKFLQTKEESDLMYQLDMEERITNLENLLNKGD